MNAKNQCTQSKGHIGRLSSEEPGGQASISDVEEWWSMLESLKNEAAATRATLGMPEALRQEELDLWNE